MCDLEGGVQMYFREANFSLYSWPNRACFMHGVKVCGPVTPFPASSSGSQTACWLHDRT